MPMTSREMVNYLKKHGFIITSQSGSHIKLFHPITNRTVIVPYHNKDLKKGLEQVKPWGFLGDMGQAVHDHAAANGYTVVREIGGHGVGLEFHEEPWVGYHSKRGEEMLLVPGMIFTIEPMVNMGKEDIITDSQNGWEVYTDDDEPSAQWEIMVLVTEEGNEVLCW